MGEYSYRPSQKSPDRPSQKSPVISRSKTAMNTSRKRRTASEYVKHPSEDREVKKRHHGSGTPNFHEILNFTNFSN